MLPICYLLCTANRIPATRAPHSITLHPNETLLPSKRIHFGSYQDLRKLLSSIPLVILLSIMTL